MRLLLVGSTAPWAIEQFYVRYLAEWGVVVEVFDPSAHIEHTLYHRILLRMGSLQPYKTANESLMEAAERFRPDIIWIFKGIEFKPETLNRIKKNGARLVNYNPDHPYIRTSVSHGGKNVADCVPLYDLHFCYSRQLAARIEREFNIPASWLPFGYELSDSDYSRIVNVEEIRRVGFVGNPDRLRARIIHRLGDAGVPVDVYGYNWKNFIRENGNIRIYNAIFGDVFWQKLRQYRVQLNIFRPHNAGSHNMRSFEIPAAGGIMLAPDSPEHRTFFVHGEEAFFYQSEEEIERYCRELLAMENVGPIREKARKRSVSEDYSYRNRARWAYNTFQKPNASL